MSTYEIFASKKLEDCLADPEKAFVRNDSQTEKFVKQGYKFFCVHPLKKVKVRLPNFAEKSDCGGQYKKLIYLPESNPLGIRLFLKIISLDKGELKVELKIETSLAAGISKAEIIDTDIYGVFNILTSAISLY